MKKVLVTGGAGFVGSNLVNRLIDLNIETIVIDNLSSGKRHNVNQKAKFYNGDIINKKLLIKISKGCDLIFHLAAMTNIQQSIAYPSECIKNNIIGTSNVIEACLINNLRLVFASSCAIYPLNYNKKINENVITNPITPYAISKKISEDLILFYKNKLKQYTILRCFNIYGKGQNPNSIYSAVIPKFIDLAKKNRFLSIYNDGSQCRDFIDVRDVVNIYIKSSTKKINGIFNVGTGKTTKIKDLAKYIIKKIGKGKIRKGKKNFLDAKYSCADIAKIKKVLKYPNKFSLKKGLLSLI